MSFRFPLNTMGHFGILPKPSPRPLLKAAQLVGSTSYENGVGTVSIYNRPEDLTSIPNQYRVLISSTSMGNYSVVSVIQEDIKMTVKSNWDSYMPMNISGIINRLAQLGGKTLTSRFTSRRIWTGTTPITIRLGLKFFAINDALKDVVIPVKSLQKLVLPSVTNPASKILPSDNPASSLPLLSPPGPSPYLTTPTLQKFFQKYFGDYILGTGDLITISIGTFLTFRSVIIDIVDATYASKFTQEGYPVEADVDLHFSTYEILTKESIDTDAYNSGVAKPLSISNQ